MKITLIEGHHLIQQRTGQDGKIRYWQNGYAHLGGAFPTQIVIPLRNPQDAYAVGDYELAPENYRVSQYGNLELNRFEMRLVPIKK